MIKYSKLLKKKKKYTQKSIDLKIPVTIHPALVVVAKVIQMINHIKKHKHHKKEHKKRNIINIKSIQKKEDKKEKKELACLKWGDYGVLKESDIFLKQEEFHSWLMEVKKLENIEMLSTAEQRKYFRDYMEDYNTCTFPSKKYYNLEAWEQELRLKASKKRKRSQTDDDEDDAKELLVFNDEEILRQERKKST